LTINNLASNDYYTIISYNNQPKDFIKQVCSSDIVLIIYNLSNEQLSLHQNIKKKMKIHFLTQMVIKRLIFFCQKQITKI